MKTKYKNNFPTLRTLLSPYAVLDISLLLVLYTMLKNSNNIFPSIYLSIYLKTNKSRFRK